MSKRKYNLWTDDDMDTALTKYTNKSMGFNEVCRFYHIPKPTFRRHLKGLNKQKSIGRPKDLSKDMEDELVKHVLDLESSFFGLRIRDLRSLAYQLAEKYELSHRFNKTTKLAGWKWYYNFMKNHPEISLRTPEPTSMARCQGFTKEIVNEFFDKYESIIDNGKFTAQQIYNVDETGLSTVHKPSKILAHKGKHQVGAVTSGERGINTTCICCMNAAGEFIPPMLIYKRTRMADGLKRGGPPNTVYTCSESGWITAELFFEWLKHFITCTKLEKFKKNQVLLVLDGHATHTKNIDAIRLARDYGIVMLSLPPHTTHKLQPLDRSFFKPLKQHYNYACTTWMRNHPGSVIKQTNIAEILGMSYPRAVCMETAIHGFESCGLWPCNRLKIRDEEYVVLSDNPVAISSINPETDLTASNHIEALVPPAIQPEQNMKTVQNSTSKSFTEDNKEPDVNTRASPSILDNIERGLANHEDQDKPKQDSRPDTKRNIQSFIQSISPKCSLPPKAKTKRGTTSQILTDSPYKKELEEKNKLKESKNAVCRNFNEKKNLKKKLDNHAKNVKNKRLKVEKENETWYCKLCKENIQEDMIQCSNCQIWVHELCAGVDKNIIDFLCDDCRELQKNISYALLN